MGEVRALAVRAERHLLRWRTRRGHETAARYLDDLAAALAPRDWRFKKFYRREEFPVPVPLLWVHAQATKDIGIIVSVLATPGRTWSYHEASRGRRGYLCPCGDAELAAVQIDRLLKHRLFPHTW
ncbi:hypothetical protein E1200_25850 [Actinomadura sp. GC306]|uniref:hypothetical protein n=1 Tax=Actinomadura sp. GC306 TaxID=2530367 RepID=UPI00104AF09A|nr:hypothetical protein [Actinomadura sp. GC306]TDC62413.1 hypothetical protein E1200_25850 [Actinomadura sp. GC306]